MINEIEIMEILNKYKATNVKFDYSRGVLKFSLLQGFWNFEIVFENLLMSNFNLNDFICDKLKGLQKEINITLKDRKRKKINLDKLSNFIENEYFRMRIKYGNVEFFYKNGYQKIIFFYINKNELEKILNRQEYEKRYFLENAILDYLIANSDEFMEEETNE